MFVLSSLIRLIEIRLLLSATRVLNKCVGTFRKSANIFLASHYYNTGNRVFQCLPFAPPPCVMRTRLFFPGMAFETFSLLPRSFLVCVAAVTVRVRERVRKPRKPSTRDSRPGVGEDGARDAVVLFDFPFANYQQDVF